MVESDPEKAAELAFDTVGQPVRSSSLFYTLYYLSEIEEREEADFDLFKITNQLDEGFQAYTIIAVTSEATNGRRRFMINGNTVSESSVSQINRFAEQQITPDNRDIVNRFLLDISERNIRTSASMQRVIGKQLEDIEERYNALSKPLEYMDAMAELFKTKPVTKSRDQIRSLNETSWTRAFAGEAWANIAGHLESRQTTPKLAWVDLSWAVEHNTGNFINKISIKDEEKKRVGRKLGIQGEETTSTVVRETTEDQILDQNFEGNIKPVIDWAVAYNDQVSIDLRAVQRQLELED